MLAAPAAFAQGDAGGGGGSATVGADATVGAGGANAGAGATVSTDGAATVGWPQEMGSRPFTLLPGGLAAYGDFNVLHVATGTGANAMSFTQEQLHLGAGYGVNDKLTVGGEITVPLAGDGTGDPLNTRLKGPLRLYGMYGLMRTDKLTVAAEAHFEINFCGTLDFNLTAGTASCGTTEAIGAGLDARYAVAPKIAVFTGSPFGPGVPGGTGGFVFPGFGAGAVGQHLNVSFDSNTPTTFDVPVGVQLQATPQLLAYLAFDLVRFNIANAPMNTDAVEVIGSDGHGIPTLLGGWFGVNKNLDVGVNITDNLKHAGDAYVLAFGARWTK